MGLAAAAAWRCTALMFDRDALALTVTAANAAANGVAVEVVGGLGSSSEVTTGRHRATRGCDLVLCNLPAKAGAPVRGALIRDCVAMLAPGGTLALVVVRPLHAETEATLASLPGVLWQRRHSGHGIFHYRADGHETADATDRTAERAVAGADRFAPYLRNHAPRTLAGAELAVRSVFGLPDFDTCSHLTQLLAALLASRPAAEWARWSRVWIWNPGQGDLASWLVDRRRAQAPDEALRLTLASRDALQIHATEANLAAHGLSPYASVHAPSPVSALHAVTNSAADLAARGDLATRDDLDPHADLIVVPVDSDVARGEGKQLLATLVRALAPGAHLVVAGKSGVVSPLLQRRRSAGGLTLLKQMRRSGQAAAICVGGS